MCQSMQAWREVASILYTTCRQVVGFASKVVSSTHPFLLNLASLPTRTALHVYCCLTVMSMRLHLYLGLLFLLQIKSAVKRSISSSFSFPTRIQPIVHLPCLPEVLPPHHGTHRITTIISKSCLPDSEFPVPL